MDQSFVFSLMLSFTVGGLMVAGCTFMAERFGTQLGGVIGGFPSTIAVSLFFIGFASSPQAASSATQIIPLVVGFNGVFLVCFAVFGQRGVMTGFMAALLGWGALAGGTILSGFQNFQWALVAFGLLLLASFWVLDHCLVLPVQMGRRRAPGVAAFVYRAIFGGTLIATAVLLSKVSGPLIGGMLSVFPAAFISTLLIAHFSRGLDFARALTKPMMVSGMINVVVYSLCVRYFYSAWGLGWGTLGALVVSSATACGTYRIVRRTGGAAASAKPLLADSGGRRDTRLGATGCRKVRMRSVA